MATNLSSNLTPASLMKLILNGDCDEEIGAFVSRLGSGIIGAQLVDTKSILGLHQYIDHSNSANNKLFAVINDSSNTNADIFDVLAGTIIAADDTASLKARFLTFLGQTVRVNGTDAPRVYNGRGFVTTATFTAATNDVITSAGHNLSDGDTIWVSNSGGALPAGLTASTTYFVRDRTTDTFKVSLTLGGAAVDITDTGSGTHTWSFQGVLDRVNMPTGHKYIAEFLDRVYLAGNTSTPDRIFYSSLQGEIVTGQVSWVRGNGYLDIEPEDGAGAVTGFGKVPGYLLIFKERSLKRWNFSSLFPESLVSIGTPSQESVVMGGGLCAFFSNSNADSRGFFITNGGRPVPISHDTTRPIKKWVDAIPSENDANISGYATERGFAWSVGNLTVDGVAYTNVHFRYNRLLDQWTVRSYPTEHKVFASYVASGVNSVIAGDNDGQIIQIDKPATYTDYPGTVAISYAVESHSLSFGTNRLKTIKDRLVVRGSNLEGMQASIIPDGVPPKRSAEGALSKVLAIFGIKADIQGTEIALRVEGQTVGGRAYIREIEAISISASANYDN